LVPAAMPARKLGLWGSELAGDKSHTSYRTHMTYSFLFARSLTSTRRNFQFFNLTISKPFTVTCFH